MTTPAELDSLILRAIADPGKVLPRGDDFTEPIPNWSARAVTAAVLPAHKLIVVEEVAAKIEAHGRKLLDEAIDRVMSDDQGGQSAAMRASTIVFVAKLLRETDWSTT